MMKIVEAIWFSPGYQPGTIGIVLVDTGFEKKAYIGAGDGIDEKTDIEKIASHGARFHLVAAKNIKEHLEKESEVSSADKYTLCTSLKCDKGKTLEVVDGVMTTRLVNCSICNGRGFRLKEV